LVGLAKYKILLPCSFHFIKLGKYLVSYLLLKWALFSKKIPTLNIYLKLNTFFLYQGSERFIKNVKKKKKREKKVAPSGV
jgi:hypothetical protein